MTLLTYVADPAAAEQRMEQVFVTPGQDGPIARGTMLVGSGPLTDTAGPFTCTYELELEPGLVTRRLQVWTEGNGWRRKLELTRHPVTGAWRGVPDPALLTGALDCDLVGSPLFNQPPILRTGLHRSPGRREILVAWVSLPDLIVTPVEQVYGHVRPGVVSFESDGFSAEIDVDDEGYVRRYPRVSVAV